MSSDSRSEIGGDRSLYAPGFRVSTSRFIAERKRANKRGRERERKKGGRVKRERDSKRDDGEGVGPGCSESGDDRAAESRAYALLRIYIFSPNPSTFHKIQRLYKGRCDGVPATLRRHFIPLNFRDGDSTASRRQRCSVFRSADGLAFISPGI